MIQKGTLSTSMAIYCRGYNSREKVVDQYKVSCITLKQCLGQCKVPHSIWKFDYNGEVDSEGNACGFGEAVQPDEPSVKIRGTFLSNKAHGYCKLVSLSSI